MAIVRPIFVIGAPRSGTTLLFSILSSHPDLWSLYRESEIIEQWLHPRVSGWSRGNALDAEDASAVVVQSMQEHYYRHALNLQALLRNSYSTIYTNRLWDRARKRLHQALLSPLLKPGIIRIVEKTPRNCLRVPFLDAVFPDGFFVFLTRDPHSNISSLMEGWRQPGKYETYDLPGGLDISGYPGTCWNFLLPPGWQDFARGVSLEEVCAFQYRMANRLALDGLQQIAPERWTTVRYHDLITCPEETVRALCSSVGLRYQGGLQEWARRMPAVNTSTEPDSDKWKKNEQEVVSVIDTVRDISRALGYSL